MAQATNARLSAAEGNVSLQQRAALILASQSQARAALLRAAGIAFEQRPARVGEAAVKAAMRGQGAGADEVALALAAMKARQVQADGAAVIGADQVLVCDGQWFDKPPDLASARAQLMSLRGRTHTLMTAVACVRDGTELWRCLARPALTMRHFSDCLLDAYLSLEGEAILSSVGAYRLEGPGIQLFDRIEGDHAAILGLPLLPLLGALRQHGVLTA